MAEELQQERVRLANRVRQQLWRYYPQLLELADGDVAAEWVLALWTMAPTPAKAARLREARLAQLFRQHRIRRIDAATALGVLRQPAIQAISLRETPRWLRVSPRRLCCTCAPLLPGCAWPTRSSAKLSVSLMSSALP